MQSNLQQVESNKGTLEKQVCVDVWAITNFGALLFRHTYMILCDDDLPLLPQVSELRERLEEVKSSGSRRMKAQLQAMDWKIAIWRKSWTQLRSM